jgi:hypothetical protein
VALARRPTKEEAVEEIEAVLSRIRSEDPAAASIVGGVGAAPERELL